MIKGRNKNKKKKGFTLIELIIVIAILAILAMILVPMIGGYRDKAEKSNIQASAKTVLSAMQAYNADHNTQITSVAAAVTDLGASGDGTLDTTKIPSAVSACTTLSGVASSYTDLQNLADGDFKILVNTGVTSTIGYQAP